MDMHVKKRGVAFALCAVLLTLVIGTSFALADTKDIPTWNAEPMTKEQMLDIYEENFAKMGTTSSIYYTAESLVDQAELDEWLVQWEERYTQETGFERKDDLIVSTTPGANDMPYDEALAYAKKLLMDKYGTPEEELDAMGVYPRLMDYVYMEDESEWEFFFTPMKDVDIDEDHDYPAPGEYRVNFQARSGEVLLCLWYIDDFWLYAQRTWDAGKHDVVYEQYQKVSFYQQDVESQTHFRTLLKDAGYDVDVERNVLGGIELDLHFAPAEESVLLSEDAYVQTALAAMKETYGLDLDTLQACAFGAFYSSLNTGTVDVCFVFNYNIANQLSEARAGEEAGVWKNLIVNYPVRLGSYMISMDADTGEVVSSTHEQYERQRENDASAKLLEKWNWTTEDAAAYRELVEVLIPQAVEQAKPNYAEHEAAVHTLLREWGGNADSFPARELEAGMISHESATAIAKNAVMEKDTLTAEEFDALYPFVEADYDYTAEVYHAYAFSRIIDGEDAAPNYYVKIDARSGEILEMDIAVGNG